MFFEVAVTVPANTPATAPIDTEVPLPAGVVTWWQMQFPGGCSGLVHTKVLYFSHQVIPTNPDGDVSADDAYIETFDDIELDTEPYVLTIRAWNTDDAFAHTVTVRFSVMSAADKLKREGALRALAYLDTWFSSQGGVSPQGGP